MSVENVALFCKAMDIQKEVKNDVAKSDASLESWVKVGQRNGFEFTADELKRVLEQTLGHKLTAQDAVREYLSSRESVGPDELNQQMLEAVAGGDKPDIEFPPMFIQAHRQTVTH